jgi:hypothetical protein
MARSLGVGTDARDLATVVDVQRVGRQAPRDIDGRDDSLVQQEAADLAPFGVDGSADDLAAVVEAQCLGWLARDVDRRISDP